MIDVRGSEFALKSGLIPVVHYLTIGAPSGFNPNPRFDGAQYLRDHPNAAAERINPLVHHAMRVTSQTAAIDRVFRGLHPEGDPGPAAVTNGRMVEAVIKELKKRKAQGEIAVIPSDDTILRAIGRRRRKSRSGA